MRVGPVSHPCSIQESQLPQIPNQEGKQCREDEEDEEGVEWASLLLVMGLICARHGGWTSPDGADLVGPREKEAGGGWGGVMRRRHKRISNRGIKIKSFSAAGDRSFGANASDRKEKERRSTYPST